MDLEEPSSYYFKGDHETLHLDDTTTHLDPFTNPDEYTYVSVDDNIYVSQTATNEYAIFVWKDKNDNNTDTIKVIYKGKSSLSTSIQPVYLQIYNYNSSVWQQLDMNDNTTADIEFTLQGRLIANVNYYYDVDNWITCRVYQHW